MPRNVWCGNLRWPSGRNLGDFARDIFRIENCTTDRDKALAFYKWFIRCFMRGPNYETPDGFGGYSRTFDALRMFASFGHFECTGFGWIPAEALQAAGLKARRVCGQNDGHTIYEVWYKGLDGKEGWHAFDAHQCWYFLNRKGEVASCEELTADHNLVHAPAGHSDPLGYNTDYAYLGKRHAWSDALDVIQQVRNETLGWDLKPGMEAAILFEPADPRHILFCGNEYPLGSHCQIPAYDHCGALLFPENEPYWNNYRRPMPDNAWIVNNGKAVRTHGCGALRWSPLLQGAEAVEWQAHAVFENNTARPSGKNKHTEIWYRLTLPYYATHLLVDGYVRCATGSDYCGVAISSDKGTTILPLADKLRNNFRLLNGLEERKNNKPSVQFLRDLWVRIELHSHDGEASPVLEYLRFTFGFQHNMFTQPLLLPGKNALWLEGAEMKGCRVNATLRYTLKGAEGLVEMESSRDGRVEKEVTLDCSRPDDITMRGITLACEKA
ncbi:MAG: hypothetical protein V1913_00355 [Fibrobacterota bacterium]